MILVRMGQNEAIEKGPLLLNEAEIGQDDVHPRQTIVGKAEPQIHHRPAAILAIQVAIDADLADAAQRHEPQIGEFHAFCPFPERMRSRFSS